MVHRGPVLGVPAVDPGESQGGDVEETVRADRRAAPACPLGGGVVVGVVVQRAHQRVRGIESVDLVLVGGGAGLFRAVDGNKVDIVAGIDRGCHLDRDSGRLHIGGKVGEVAEEGPGGPVKALDHVRASAHERTPLGDEQVAVRGKGKARRVGQAPGGVIHQVALGGAPIGDADHAVEGSAETAYGLLGDVEIPVMPQRVGDPAARHGSVQRRVGAVRGVVGPDLPAGVRAVQLPVRPERQSAGAADVGELAVHGTHDPVVALNAALGRPLVGALVPDEDVAVRTDGQRDRVGEQFGSDQAVDKGPFQSVVAVSPRLGEGEDVEEFRHRAELDTDPTPVVDVVLQLRLPLQAPVRREAQDVPGRRLRRVAPVQGDVEVPVFHRRGRQAGQEGEEGDGGGEYTGSRHRRFHLCSFIVRGWDQMGRQVGHPAARDRGTQGRIGPPQRDSVPNQPSSVLRLRVAVTNRIPSATIATDEGSGMISRVNPYA